MVEKSMIATRQRDHIYRIQLNSLRMMQVHPLGWLIQKSVYTCILKDSFQKFAKYQKAFQY